MREREIWMTYNYKIYGFVTQFIVSPKLQSDNLKT